MNVVEITVVLYGAIAFLNLGLISAKTELGVRTSWGELAYKVVLAPFTVIGELRDFERVQVVIISRANRVTLEMFRELRKEKPDDLKGAIFALLYGVDADLDEANQFLVDLDAHKAFQPSPLRRDMVLSQAEDRDLREFALYYCFDAGLSDDETQQVINRIEDRYHLRIAREESTIPKS